MVREGPFVLDGRLVHDAVHAPAHHHPSHVRELAVLARREAPEVDVFAIGEAHLHAVDALRGFGGAHCRGLLSSSASSAWESLSTVPTRGFFTTPCAILRSVEMGTPEASAT